MPTFGDQVRQFGGAPVTGPLTTSKNAFFLEPGTGSNSNSGKKPGQGFGSTGLSTALSKMPADEQSVLYLVAQDNSASGTTARISAATLDWNKDGTIIQGVAGGGGLIGSRARISNTADTTDVSPLMTWSASNGSMRNVHVFYGENDAGDLGAFNVTGERNYFYRCHFAGIGNATQDAAGAYSLRVSGDENLFEECVIGLDTIGRGSAKNSELLLSGQATRNIFRNCIFLTYADADTHQFIIVDTLGLDRWVLFENCSFINAVDAGATTMTEALDLPATMGGSILLKNSTLFGVTEWDAGDGGEVLIDGAAPSAATSGIAIEPAT
jgi:hypothetical protein